MRGAAGLCHRRGKTCVGIRGFIRNGKAPDERLAEIVNEHFDLRPAAIIKRLELRRPIYRQVAAYGHFGRTDIDLPWERLDKVDELRKEI